MYVIGSAGDNRYGGRLRIAERATRISRRECDREMFSMGGGEGSREKRDNKRTGMVRHKELTKEELEYQRNALKD